MPLREGGFRLNSESTLLPSASRRFVFLSWHAVVFIPTPVISTAVGVRYGRVVAMAVLQWLVLGVLTATQPFKQHLNFTCGPLTEGTVPSTGRPRLVERSADRGHRPEERPLLSRYPCGRCRS